MDYAGKYALGLWGYTTNFDDLSDVDRTGNPIEREGTYGLYGLAEQIVYREPQDSEQHLTLFARFGLADPRVNRFSQYYGGGLIYRGLIPGRHDDEIGIGVAAAFNGSHFKRSQRRAGVSVDDSEIALELTYAFNLLPDIVLQPDVQYILNPANDPTVDHAFVAGVRLEVSINWFGGPPTSVEIQK